MKKLLSRLALPLSLALFSSGSWAIMIDDTSAGGLDGTDVGGLDIFIAEQAGPFTGGDGNPDGEETWAESVLNMDLVFAGKEENISIFNTNTTDVRTFELSFGPGYFILKNSTWRALFENVASIDWAVIDTSLLDSGFNLNDTTISHATEFDGGDTGETGDETGDVPVPGTLALLGLGLLGLSRTRRRKAA